MTTAPLLYAFTIIISFRSGNSLSAVLSPFVKLLHYLFLLLFCSSVSKAFLVVSMYVSMVWWFLSRLCFLLGFDLKSCSPVVGLYSYL